MSDLVQLGRLARVFGGLVPGLDVKPITAELRERIVEELDYRLEAEAQQAFADAFADDPDFVIPNRVARNRHGAGHRVAGGHAAVGGSSRGHPGGARPRRPAATCASCSPARRSVGLLHADPHPGNFRLHARTAGSASSTSARSTGCPRGCPASIGRLLAIALDGRRATRCSTGCARRASSSRPMRLDAQELLDYLAPLRRARPPRRRSRFSRAWLRAEAARISDPRRADFSLGPQAQPAPVVPADPPGLAWAAIGVLCQLEAEVSTRPEMERWLPGFADA